MEKFGVDVETGTTKEASGEPKKTCPTCGRELLPLDASNVPRCPFCGTQPFEKR